MLLLLLLCTESLKSPKTSTRKPGSNSCRVCLFVCVRICVCVCRHTDNISDFNLIINALVVQPKTDTDNVRAQPVNNYRVCSNCKPPATAATANGLQQVN